MINIKLAEPDDVPIILSLIKELAEYEELSDSVVATEDDLIKYIFHKDKLIYVLIAYYDNIPVGFTLFFHNFSTFVGKLGIYLEDIYIKSDFRNLGIGKMLLKEIAKIAVEKDCGRLEWSVLNWNPARKFYEHLGAKALDEWLIYRLDGNNLKQLAED